MDQRRIPRTTLHNFAQLCFVFADSPEKPADAEATEGEEGAEGAEAAAADGDKPATEGDKKEGDKKEGDDKKPTDKKAAEQKKDSFLKLTFCPQTRQSA